MSKNSVFPPKETVEKIKTMYKRGMRVKLIRMDDQYTKMPVGIKGTVSHVDDTGTIFTEWDNGSGLGLVYGEDRAKIIHSEEVSIGEIANMLYAMNCDMDADEYADYKAEEIDGIKQSLFNLKEKGDMLYNVLETICQSQ